MERLTSGVNVKLFLECDSQNFKPEGLDFQAFIQAGGQIYVLKGPGLMHHKFVVIDGKLVLNGSFNWTYNSNAENLIVLDDEVVVRQFEGAFSRMIANSERIVSTEGMTIKAFSAYPLFVATEHSFTELKLKIACGATVWRVSVEAQAKTIPAFYLQRKVFFDHEGTLTSYWRQFPTWNREAFEELFTRPMSREQAKKWSILKKWALGMRTGDIIVACDNKKRSFALGVVQSEPQKSALNGYSTCREVHWLEMPVPFSAVSDLLSQTNKVPVRHRGSSMRLLQAIFKV
jgi:Phosphatidylserine/phosphatidylglycerophosphate/cardiolipin synthases and related enzymes